MHLIVASLAGSGHLNPTLALTRELVRRGHRVTYLTDESARDAVEAAGATLVPEAGFAVPAFDPRAGGPPAAGILGLMRGQLQVVADGALEERVRALAPDALLVDQMTPAGRAVAERTGTPLIGLSPTYATNAQFTFRDIAANGDALHGGEERAAAFRQMRDGMAEIAAEYGIDPGDLFGGTPAPLTIVFLPRALQYSAEAFDDSYRFVGPCLDERPLTGTWQPPTDGRPLLFVSLGTTPFNNNPDFFRSVVDAFADGAWNVAIAVGKQLDVDALGPVPANVEIRPFFPQLDVLAHATAFLSHAGMNSTMEALYYGVPIVAVPQQPEQGATAQRLVELGLGRRVTGVPAPAELRAAVEEAGSDPEIRRNLDAMRELVRSSGGAPAAATAIETHLS